MGVREESSNKGNGWIQCKDVLLTFQKQTGVLGKVLGLGTVSRPMPVRAICQEGACFLSKEGLREGTALELTVDFGPHRPTIHLGGSVLRTGAGHGRYPHRVEVAFTEVNRRSGQVLGNLREVCTERKKNRSSWRLHHTRRHQSRPGGALETPTDERKDAGGARPTGA